jgi:nitrate reductase assembly molybdenum cofactor insertion protein NarJ
MPEMEQAGVRLDGELPDFLPVLLRLLARLPDEEDATLLVVYLIAPGLAKMVAAVEGASDPWSAIVRALDELLRELVPAGARETKEAHAHA